MFAKVKQKIKNSHCAKHLNLGENVREMSWRRKQALSSFEPLGTCVKNPRKVSDGWYGSVISQSLRNRCPPKGGLPEWALRRREAVVEPPSFPRKHCKSARRVSEPALVWTAPKLQRSESTTEPERDCQSRYTYLSGHSTSAVTIALSRAQIKTTPIG